VANSVQITISILERPLLGIGLASVIHSETLNSYPIDGDVQYLLPSNIGRKINTSGVL